MVSWPEEEDVVSIISNLRNNVSGPMVVGELCEVIERKKNFCTTVNVPPFPINQSYMCQYVAGPQVHKELFISSAPFANRFAGL